MDANNSNIMYASLGIRRTAWSFSSGGTKSALYKTIDGGKRNKIHNGFVKEIRRMAVTIAPYPNILYAVLEAEKKGKEWIVSFR
jgi:hypothetical protein